MMKKVAERSFADFLEAATTDHMRRSETSAWDRSMTEPELTDFATRYTEAWCSHDANATAGFFAEDGSIAVNGGEPAVSRAEIAQLVQGFYDAFPDTVVIMDAVRGAADKAVYLWTYVGTNTGPGGTGKKVRFNGWEAWTLSEDGLISQSIGTFDADEYERQLAEGVGAIYRSGGRVGLVGAPEGISLGARGLHDHR